jgi:hypothetical protein
MEGFTDLMEYLTIGIVKFDRIMGFWIALTASGK